MSNQANKPKPKYLVVSSSGFFDVDKLAAALVWGKVLAENHNAQVDIFLGLPKLPKELIGLVAPEQINFKEKLESDYFTVTLDKGNAEIKEVRWEEQNNQVKILIFTDKGEVDTKEYSSHPGHPHYDSLYVFGIADKQKALSTLGEFSNLWDMTKTINIDITSRNKGYAQENHLYPDHQSYAQAVLSLAAEQELEINADHATELLACIYWKTNSFRNKYSQGTVFTDVEKLIGLGASVQTATTKVFSSLSFIELKARQEIYNNLKITQDKLAFSKVNKDTARILIKTNPIYPDKNPLFKMSDVKASFVLIPLSDTETLVLASSNTSKLSLKHTFADFGFLGDNLQAEFTMNSSLEDSEAKIKQLIGDAKFETKPKVSDTAASKSKPWERRKPELKPQPEPEPTPAIVAAPAADLQPKIEKEPEWNFPPTAESQIEVPFETPMVVEPNPEIVTDLEVESSPVEDQPATEAGAPAKRRRRRRSRKGKNQDGQVASNPGKEDANTEVSSDEVSVDPLAPATDPVVVESAPSQNVNLSDDPFGLGFNTPPAGLNSADPLPPSVN